MKRTLALLLCTLLVLALFAGCSAAPAETPAETPTDTQAPSSEANEPAAQQTTTQPEEGKTPVTIHLFHQKQEAQETFAKIIDECAAQSHCRLSGVPIDYI